MSHHAHTPSLANTIRAILRKPKTTLALLGMPGIAFAGPTGEVVVGGEAVVTRPNDVTTHIDQITNRAAINWWSFNVDADEYVIFDQPDASSIILNRVIGGDPSQIFGQILANGQVFLLNPQGVFFAPGASVDVQGLLASSLDMDPNDFMNGDFSLTRADNASANGNVINDGTITAGTGGYVMLAGDFVDNTGLITANAGTIALVAGNALTLDIEGDGLVNFAVNEATLSDVAGVRNAGSLIADGGMVVMTAQVANQLTATVVNNEGLVRAHSIEEHGGEIYLVGQGGNVANSGTLDADGENADGGTIIVYGDQDVTLADGGVQTAAGDGNHEGGFMRFIAEDVLDYQADNLIRATGGVSGGFVEVSGHGSINLRGIPDIGAGGSLLIDPTFVAITAGSAAPQFSSGVGTYSFVGAQPSYADSGESITAVGRGYIENQLDLGVTVTLVASEAIFVDALTPITIAATGAGNLNFYIGLVGSAAGASSAADGVWNGTAGQTPSITPSSDLDTHQLDLGNLDINIDGNVLLDAGTTGTVAIGSITTPGNVTLTGSTVSVGSGFNGISSAGNVTINGNVVGSNLQIGNSTNGVSQITINGNVNLTSGMALHALSGIGLIDINGSINAGSGVWLNASGAITSGGDINVSGGVVAGGSLFASATGPAGNITFGSFASATAGITMTALSTFTNGGNITVGFGLLAGGNIDLTATAGSASGGNIDIQAGGIGGTSGAVTLTATGGTWNGGNVTVIGAGPKGIAAGTGLTITATGNGASNDNPANANVRISGQVQGGAGDVTIRAIQNGTGRGGLIDIAGNGSAGHVQGQSVTLEVTGAGTASGGGRIELGTGTAEVAFQGALLTAQTGDINVLVNGTGDGVFVAGNMNAAGNITINNNGVGQGHIHIGDYSSGFLPANVTAGGSIGINASGSAAAFDAGTLSAGGNLNVTVANFGGAGNLRIAGITAADIATLNINAVSGSINIGNHSGINTGLTINTTISGNHDIGSLSFAGNFNYNGPTASIDFVGPVNIGGTFHVDANSAILLAGVNITAGGDIIFTSNVATLGFQSGGSYTLDAGGDIVLDQFNLDIIDTGATVNYSALGDIRIRDGAQFDAGTLTAGGMLMVNALTGMNIGNASAGSNLFLDIDDGNLATGNLTAGGIVNVNTNHTSAASVIIGDVNADHIDLHFRPSTSLGLLTVNLGNLTATGTASFNRDVVVMVDGGSGASSANVTIASATASNGEVALNLFPGASGSPAGTLTVTGAVNAAGRALLNAPTAVSAANVTAGAISITGSTVTTGNLSANGTGSLSGWVFVKSILGATLGSISAQQDIGVEARDGNIAIGGAITASNADGQANVSLTTNVGGTGGSISVNGPITVSGHAGSGGQGQAAFLHLDANAGGGNNITVGGAISVTGFAGTFSGTTFSGDVVSGNMGAAAVFADAGAGSVSFGNISVNGVGNGDIRLLAYNITTGNLAVNVSDGSLTRNFTDTCGGTCNLTGTETITSGGRGEILLMNSAGTTGATANVGSMSITAGDAEAGIFGYQNVTVGGPVTVTATGVVSSNSSNGTANSETVNFSETTNGAHAAFMVHGANSASVTVLGDVNVTAPGGASIDISADSISVQTLNATATAGTFTRTGSPAFSGSDDGPFGNDDFGSGPRIDEGTLTGGQASIRLAGFDSSFSGSGHILANSVNVAGSIAVSAPGEAFIQIAGENIGVIGSLTATGGLATQNGTRSDEFTDSVSGDTILETSTVVSSYGEGGIDLVGGSAGSVTVGDLAVSGPTAGGHIEGGTLNIGAITLTGTGGDVDVVETRTNTVTSEVSSFEFHGPALLTGFGIEGTGNVTVNGAINVNAVGGGGMIISGNAISLQDVTINVTDAAYQILDVAVFGAGMHSFTLGDALLDIDAATTASTGNVTITAGEMAYVGGGFTATGAVTISADTSFEQNVRAEVQYLDALGDDGGSGSLALSGAPNVSANTMSLSVGAGGFDLTGATLTTIGDLTLGANSIDLTGLALNVGGNLNINGSALTLGGGSTANYDLITNISSLTLGTVGNVTITNAANTGTLTVSQSGTAGTLDISHGGTIDITSDLSADAIALFAENLTWAANTLTATSFMDLFIDNAMTGTGLLTAPELYVENHALGGVTLNTNTGDLFLAVAGSVNIDNTAHTGPVNIGFGVTAPLAKEGGIVAAAAAVTDAVFTLSGDAIFTTAINVSSLTINGVGIDLNGQAVTIGGIADFNLTGDLMLNGGNLAAGTLTVDAANITDNAIASTLSANALAMHASGSIDLDATTLSIGNGVVAGETGDARLLDLLAGENVRPGATTPNATFSAGTVRLGDVSMTGSYFYVESNTFSIGSFTGSAPNTLVQLATLDPAASIGVEDQPAATATVNYSNAEHLSAFNGYSIAIGTTDSSGDIAIGANGIIDIGNTNLFVLTTGTITGLDKVISTGIVKDLDSLLGVGVDFDVPQSNEIDVRLDTHNELSDEYATEEDDEEGEQEGEDTEDESGGEGDDDSLIRQDTVDEELVCS